LRKSRKPRMPHLGQSRPWERARLTPRRGLMHKENGPLLGVEKWLPEVESDSISKSSDSFCLSASRIALSSAREFEGGIDPCPFMLSLMFRALPSAYQTPIPAVAFSHPLLTADPSVLILVCHPLGSITGFILGGALPLRKGSLSFDLCPGNVPIQYPSCLNNDRPMMQISQPLQVYLKSVMSDASRERTRRGW